MDIFIDDAWVGKSFQSKWPMIKVDYVEINKTGIDAVGGGLRGAGGIIKIYTNPKTIDKKNNGKKGQAYSIPLKFASKKTFYVPKYQYYNDDFYKYYGTIDWKPEIKSDKEGHFNITINKPGIPFTLIIEGIVNDGSYIYEEKTMSLN